jgi:hypothetical protein
MNKPVVIQVNINNYEFYREYNNIENYNLIDWYYFTDDKNLKSNFWNIININEIEEIKNTNYDNRQKCKYIKMMTHKLLPNNSNYIWIDGSFPIINKNFVNEILEFKKNNYELILYDHNSRNREKTITHEVIRCRKVADKNKMDEQINAYLSDNYPNKRGGLYSSGIIFRKNTQKINELFELWFEHNLKYTTRDQISLPYVLWKLKIKPSKVIHENINLNTLVGKREKKKRNGKRLHK